MRWKCSARRRGRNRHGEASHASGVAAGGGIPLRRSIFFCDRIIFSLSAVLEIVQLPRQGLLRGYAAARLMYTP